MSLSGEPLGRLQNTRTVHLTSHHRLHNAAANNNSMASYGHRISRAHALNRIKPVEMFLNHFAIRKGVRDKICFYFSAHCLPVFLLDIFILVKDYFLACGFIKFFINCQSFLKP